MVVLDDMNKNNTCMVASPNLTSSGERNLGDTSGNVWIFGWRLPCLAEQEIKDVLLSGSSTRLSWGLCFSGFSLLTRAKQFGSPPLARFASPSKARPAKLAQEPSVSLDRLPVTVLPCQARIKLE